MEKVKAAKAIKKNAQSTRKQETLPFLHTNKISKQKVSIYFYIDDLYLTINYLILLNDNLCRYLACHSLVT